MTKTAQIFHKFVQKHIPLFERCRHSEVGDCWYYCGHVLCQDCVLNEQCSGNITRLTDEEYDDLRSTFPELFI